MAMSLSSTFTGVVAAVNDKGLRLDGHESWMNLSKFAPGVVLPERGSTVTVAVDGKGFIRSVEHAEGAPVAAPTQNGHQTATSGQQRDRLIVRQSSAKTAFEFAASRPDMRAVDAIHLASLIEAWVYREEKAE